MSKLTEAPLSYSFDDFILVPQYSEVKSRKDPVIATTVPGFEYDIPVVSSPMNTITESSMLVAMYTAGGVGVLHRYMSIRSQVKVVQETITRLSDVNLQADSPPFYVAVGANGDVEARVLALADVGVRGFCVDVANGHNEQSIQAVRNIRKLVPTARIMAGNVATYDGAFRLAKAGSNSIRVGIGGGSVCTTRQVTGHGLPQLTAIEDCARIKSPQLKHTESFPDVAIIADGGIRKSGDLIKALAAGADAVMIGSLLAGTEETPGKYLDVDGQLYKYYHGMASDEGRAQWSGQNTGVPAEGVSTKVLYTGKSSVKVVETLCGSVRVGLSFSGAMNLSELREKATWCRVSGAGYIEGTPHGK